MKKLSIIFASIALSAASLFGMHHPFDDVQSFQDYQHKTQDTHYLLGVAIDGRCIELEDRSTWLVPRSAHHIIANWQKGDPLFVTPTTSWFCRGEYLHDLRNLSTGETIPIKLDCCPDKNGPYTKFVKSIDRGSRRVVLINHYKATFTFDLHPSDNASLDDWELGDRVFVATNKEWWSEPSHRMLLINTETGSQTRASE